LISLKLFSKSKYKNMGGGLMQLVAYGAQDIYLTGNPQITFFKVVYRRHTNFSMETIEQTINGSQTASGSGSVTISRNGDLVHKVYVTCADVTAAAAAGNLLIDNIELEIGGQRIDKQTTQWNQIWADLTTPESKAAGFQCMTGGCSNANTLAVGEVQVPLNFWFCRNPGLALPLIALQYHEVKLKCVWGTAVGTRKVVCDYIYLDTDERRRFAQVSHEYLIEQIQEQNADTSGSFKLNFNHPVKELIWTSAASNSYGTAQLKLNGHDRFSAQQEEYFQLRQPLDYHTAVPGQNIVLTDRPQLLATQIVIGGTNKGQVANTAVTSSLPVAVDASEAGYVQVFSATYTPLPGDVFSLSNSTAGGTNAFQFTGVVASVATTASVHLITPVDAVATTPAADTAANDETTFTVIARIQDPLSRTGSLTSKINVYSFALKPEEHQPSGTCNFSRIDTAKLDIGTAGGMTTSDKIYAVNYNVLRIMSGMGGLAYSN
jgi:hypothetical protein